jgi:hypothetical protein
MRKALQALAIGVATGGVMLGLIYVLPGVAVRWVVGLLPMGLIVVLAGIHGFTLPDDYLKRWTKSHGLKITEEKKPVVRRYLLRGRRIRTVGALSGLLAYSIWTEVVGQDPPDVGWLKATFGGYLLGAALAEIWAVRIQAQGIRAATLIPRRVTDYVPRYALIGIRVIPVATVFLAVFWNAIPLAEFHKDSPFGPPSAWPVAAWAAVSVVIAVLVETTQRRIVHRAQPAASEELVVIDDAIRSTAVHGLAGAGLAIMLMILAERIGDIQSYIGPEALYKSFSATGLLAGFASFFAWARLGIDQPWVVRRSRPTEVAA